MNPYYAAGFLSALVFWVWPAFLFSNFDVHWLTVLAVSAILFLGIGKLATEYHLDHIAPKEPPRGPKSHMVVLCMVVFAMGLVTRVLHYFAVSGA